jgi:hypothetical protein
MSAYTLFDLTYRVARELGVVREGTATGGSQTTIIDTIYLLNRFNDDHFNAGTAWILYDAVGSGAAPQGEMGRISDFVKTTGVVTVSAALTAAVAAGDRYAVADAEYTKDMLTQAINDELALIMVPYLDDATITTDEETTEYDLPTGVLAENIEVWFNINDTTDDNYWTQTYDWYVQANDPSNPLRLIFKNQPIQPYDVRIKYWLPHPPLYAATSEIRLDIDVNRIVLGAAYKCLLWKKAQPGTNDSELDKKIAELGGRAEMAKWRSPARKEHIKLNIYGGSDSEEIY